MRVGRGPRARLALRVLRVLFERGIEMHPTLLCRRFHVVYMLVWEWEGEERSVLGVNLRQGCATGVRREDVQRWWQSWVSQARERPPVPVSWRECVLFG